MTKIYKYELPVDGQWHDLPVDAAVTGVDAHPFNNQIVLLWAVHHEGTENTLRVKAFPTGADLPPNTHFPENIIGTVVTADRTRVWHVISTWYPGNE